MKDKKQNYQAPAIEVIQVENEGVMASSADRVPNQPWRRGVANAGNPADTGSTPLDDIQDILSKNA